MTGLVTLAEVTDARARLRGIIRQTPVVSSHALSRLAGREVLLKPEYRQRTGSFKIRGAYNHLSRLAPGLEVVAASAGNHAQGVALAAALCQQQATIFMPRHAALPKIDATRSYGAIVILEGASVEESLRAAASHAAERGAHLVPPFDDPLVIAGQGTVGLEVGEEAPDAGVVIVPVGGGGLIAGMAAALAHTRPGLRIVGVEATGAPTMRAALDAQRPVLLDEVNTMADGIALRSTCELALAHVLAYVDDVVSVSEEEISQSVLLCLERAKAVVEPSGAVALAALLAGRVGGTGAAVAVLSGGNVDPLLLIRLIDHGLSAAGRYLALRIVLDDQPGSLAALTAAAARMGLNVLEVTHRRAGVNLAVREVEVLMTLETRDPSHSDEIVEALRGEGFRVER